VESNHSKIEAFEKHTKGFVMRMLSKFRYGKGKGLGKYGQGRAEPIEVHERPLWEGLGYVGEYSEEESPMICCTHY
jgi:G patch domain-containing protein 2